MFISIRSAASWCQPLQLSVVPRGARTVRGLLSTVITILSFAVKLLTPDYKKPLALRQGERREPAVAARREGAGGRNILLDGRRPIW